MFSTVPKEFLVKTKKKDGKRDFVWVKNDLSPDFSITVVSKI